MNNNNLERVDQTFFRDHPHLLNTWTYGAHPQRIMVACFQCQKCAIVNWKDTYGRTLNRIVGLLPAAFTLTAIVVTIVITVIAILPLAPR